MENDKKERNTFYIYLALSAGFLIVGIMQFADENSKLAIFNLCCGLINLGSSFIYRRRTKKTKRTKFRFAGK